jgi:phosphoribosylglycinamide formyltransferase-1
MKLLMVKKDLNYTMAKICIMASGQGTNAQNIINYFKDKNLSVELIVTDKFCGALNVAKENGIDHTILVSWSSLIPIMKSYNPDLVVLAGFLKKVPKELLDEFKVINIHPSLLPKFGGKGMFGLNVHKSVIDSGDKESGITIHWVNSEYDKGEIIGQYKCDVGENDTPESLQNKIKELEMKYLPKVISELLTL